jgi:hypothetical protein
VVLTILKSENGSIYLPKKSRVPISELDTFCHHYNHPITQQEKAKEWFIKRSSDMRIPRIVMELAAKFHIKSKEEITVDEVLSKNESVDQFLDMSRRKEQIIDKSSIPADIALGESSTHWWTRFNSTTTSIPSTPSAVPASASAAPPATSITTPSTIAAPATPTTSPIVIPPQEPRHMRLSTVRIPSLGHRWQPSRLKCPSSAKEKEESGSAMAPQKGSAEPEQKRTKR